MIKKIIFPLFFVLSLPLYAFELQQTLSVEGRIFAQSSLFKSQHKSLLSLAYQAELYHEWDDATQSFTFTPFLRIENADEERQHFDIRELKWIKSGNGWEFRIGIDKAFWGVAESIHLVDIINQTDLVENLDGEQKLGQPLIKLSTEQSWGTFDVFIMPWFRERIFPGKKGRFRTIKVIDQTDAEYEASNKQKHTDLALRWSHSLGDWDLALSHFYGTSRDPLFLFDSATDRLTPFYPLINQTGLEIQATIDEWLLKFEGIHRIGQDKHAYSSGVAGFEYSLYNAFGTDGDLGIISELILDDRGRNASTPFNKEIFIGLRWAANNTIGTELLTGFIQDLDAKSTVFNFELAQRLNDNIKFSVQIRAWANVDKKDLQYAFNRDDYIELKLEAFF